MKTRILITLVAFVLASCTPQSTDVVEAPAAPVTAIQAFNTTSYAPQNRPDVRGLNGAVSAGHPLAAQTGLRILQEGGNATDAIIAMAGVLAVVRHDMNGIGGDAFGILKD
ncbi:MAG: gamma-glutamyltransferase, partial [Gammaproteobacteria bacterium]|nr:gamma-glutamyltransferase [Gammaproteobacteria bacterium]